MFGTAAVRQSSLLRSEALTEQRGSPPSPVSEPCIGRRCAVHRGISKGARTKQRFGIGQSGRDAPAGGTPGEEKKKEEEEEEEGGKKERKVQIHSLIIAVGNYRSLTHTHTHTLAHKTNKHTLWDSFRNVRVLPSSLPLRTLSLRYFFRFNNGTVTSTRASSCLIWHKILSHFIWHQQCPCFVIAVCFQMTLLQQLSDTKECFCACKKISYFSYEGAKIGLNDCFFLYIPY